MNKHICCTRWAFDLSIWTPTLPQLTQAVAAIQPEERLRLMKFYFIEDFLSSLIGRLMMRKYVSNFSGLPYHEVKFVRDVRGKPYWLRDNNCNQPLSFNVSHQGAMVVLAGVTSSVETCPPTGYDIGVGVDVMKIEYSSGKPLKEFFRLMCSKFSEQEWSYITRPQHNERTQLKAFMRNWCLKEAYVKELGVGVTIDLKKLNFGLDTTLPLDLVSSPLTGATLSTCEDVLKDWHFEEHLLEEKYCSAIAFRNCHPQKGKFQFLRFDDLIVRSSKAEQQEIVAYCRTALQKQRKH